MPAAMNLDKKSLLAFAERERSAFERALEEFVEIPTVSSEPERKGDIRRCADRAASLIREFGGQAEVLETAGNPLVHGTFSSGAGAPSVTIYNHLDVQLASRETEPWDTDPFDFTRQGDRYLGRGTTDDKGPALTALWGIRAAREAGVPVNMQLLWELEEEIGSPNFESGVREHVDKLKTDSVLVSDTIWVSRDRRRGAQSDRRADEARLRHVRPRHWKGEDQRLLRRRGSPLEAGAGGLPPVRLHGQEVQERSRIQIDPHRGRTGGHEESVGHADHGDPRPGGRLQRAGDQDRGAAASGGEGVMPAGSESESQKDHEIDS